MAKPVFPDLGKYCTYQQATASATATKLGLKNVPNAEQYQNMVNTYNHIIVPVFEKFGVGVINSFFRSAAVNKAVGGSPTSNHLRGMAVDLDYDSIPNVTNVEVFDWIRTNLPYWELISEVPNEKGNPRWVHCAYNKDNLTRKLTKRMIYGKKGEKIYQLYPWKWSK